MSSEHHDAHDPFWTHDVRLAQDVPLRDGPQVRERAVRLRLHVSDERYPAGQGSAEIVPLPPEPGTRVYVPAHPYVLVPDMTLQIGLHLQPSDTGAMGEVISARVEGTRPWALWRGFEQQLLTLFPEAQQIVTPSWDPDYPADEWHQLLAILGYTPATPLAFTKPVTPDAQERPRA